MGARVWKDWKGEKPNSGRPIGRPSQGSRQEVPSALDQESSESREEGPFQGRVHMEKPQGWVSWKAKETEKVTMTLRWRLGSVVILLTKTGNTDY